MDDSYRWDLWGAAYLANGGCSDDGFDYFRGWLIGQGRKVSARCAGATREYGRRYVSSMTTMREASRTVLEDVVRFARCFNRPSAGGV